MYNQESQNRFVTISGFHGGRKKMSCYVAITNDEYQEIVACANTVNGLEKAMNVNLHVFNYYLRTGKPHKKLGVVIKKIVL